MNQLFPAHDRTSSKRKPWVGDLIAAYDKQFPFGSDRQLKRRMVLVASSIMLLHVGWSLVPLVIVGILWFLLGSMLLPFVSVTLLWSLLSFFYFKGWWKSYHDVDDKISVTRADAPALFEMIDEVCLKLGDG